MPYTDGNFYIRSPNTHFDANVEFNDEARVVTGSIGTGNSTKGLMFDGNYQTGQYRHRFRKRDMGGGIPLYIDYAHATASSYSELARFGTYTGNSYEFEVQGDINATGNLYDGGNAVWHTGNDGSGSGLDADTVDGLNPNATAQGSTIASRDSSGDVHARLFRSNYATQTSNIGSSADIAFRNDTSDNYIRFVDGTRFVNWLGNHDGSGSGLDADLLDGKQGADLFNFGYAYSSNNITRAVGSGAQWYKVASFSGGVKHITMKVHSSGDNTTGADSFFIAAGSYGMKANIVRMPSSKYNGTKLEEVRTKYVSGATYEIWVKVASITTSVGYLQVFMNDSGVTSSLSAGTEPTVGTADATLPVSASDRINYSLQATNKIEAMSGFVVNGSTVWHAGNDGSGSGLDADTLDGVQLSSIARLNHDNAGEVRGTNLKVLNGGVAYFYTASSNLRGYIQASETTPHLRIATSGNESIGFFDGGTGGTENIRITGGGDLELYQGHLQLDNNLELRSKDTGGTVRTITRINNSNVLQYGWSGSGHVSFMGGGSYTERMRIDSSGFIQINSHSNSWSGGLRMISQDGTDTYQIHPDNNGYMYVDKNWYFTGAVSIGSIGQYAWHSGNDGSGSGLDADTLDGQHGSYYYGGVSRGTNQTYIASSTSTSNRGNYGAGVWSYSGYSTGGNRPFTYDATLQVMASSAMGFELSVDWLSQSSTPLKIRSLRDCCQGWSDYSTVWTSSTDGSGSGLDADTVDGKHKDFLMHYKGIVSGNWDTIFSQTDGHMGVYEVQNISNTDSNYPSGAYTYGGVLSWQLDNSTFKMYAPHTGGLYIQNGWNNDEYSGWRTVWDSGNDGSGSGLDADLLDGQHGSYYLNYNNLTNKPTVPTNNNQLTNGAGYITSSGTANQSHMVSGSAFGTTSSPGSVLEYQQASGQTDTKLAPSTDWHNTIRMGHGNPYSYYSSTIAVRMTGTGTGDLYTQNIGNNSANGWRKHWNDANDGSGSGLDADTLDGNHASAFLTTSGTAANSQLLDSLDSTKFTYYRGVASGDWDSIFTTGTGKTQTSGLYQINNTTGGSYSNYPGTIMGITPYSYGGVFAWNLANHTFKLYSTHVGNLFYQSGWNNDEYSGWRMILDSGNYSSAGIWGSANDGSGSGLDADLLDGQHASAFLTSETLSSTNTVTVTGTKYFQPAGSATSPLGGGGGSSLQAYAPNNGTAAYMGFHRSSQYAINWGLDTSNTMVLGGWSSSTTVPRMSIGTNGMMVTAGQGTLWGASNDGAGSGLDADTVDGLQVHTARNNVADRIVRTNIHGYIDTGYINTINNDMTTTLATKVYVSNDNYIRHHDMNSFRSLMNVSANGNYNGREQSTSDQNYWVGSMGWGTTNLNNILHYGSGFWDSWGTPDNRPSTYTTHWTGINMMHYSASNTYHHGGQMAMGAGNPAHTYLRGWWANGGSGYGWQKIWTDGNDGSGSGLDADLLDGQHGSYYARKTYWPDVNTRLGQDAHSLTNLNTQALWSQPSGYQTMVHAGNSNGLPSSHGQSYFGYTITSRRDTGTGYSALLTSYDNSNMYFTYNSDEANYSTWRKLWHDGNDGSGSGLDADLLDGYNSAENGANTIHRLASNGYSQIQNWQNVGNAGIYSTTQNGAHFTPNTATSYGTWKTSGSRGGYDGIVFDSGGDQAIMYDGSGNGGIFKQGHAWIHYYHVGNSCSAFGDSTTSSSYEVYVHGTLYATGNVIAYSDRRIKENVVQIDGALEKVNNLVGVYYNKKDDESKQKEIGFIAQDVKEVVPELVNYAEDTDQYGVKYQNTTALLVEAVKELTQQVNDLKKELEEIKNDK